MSASRELPDSVALNAPGAPVNRAEQLTPRVDIVASRSVKRELLSELRASWSASDRVPPEQLLSRWPGAAEAPDAVSLLFEDYLQRQQHGQPVSASHYSKQF